MTTADDAEWFMHTDASFEACTAEGGLGGVLVNGSGIVKQWFSLTLNKDQCQVFGSTQRTRSYMNLRWRLQSRLLRYGAKTNPTIFALTTIQSGFPSCVVVLVVRSDRGSWVPPNSGSGQWCQDMVRPCPYGSKLERLPIKDATSQLATR